MTDQEMQEFGDALQLLMDTYGEHDASLDVCPRRRKFTASVQIGRFIFGYGSRPMEAVKALIAITGSPDAMRKNAARTLRKEAQEKLDEAARLEAANV